MRGWLSHHDGVVGELSETLWDGNGGRVHGASVTQLTSGSRSTAAAFWARAVAWFATLGITCERVITDDGACYREGLWHRACPATGTTVNRTRPRRPQSNGKSSVTNGSCSRNGPIHPGLDLRSRTTAGSDGKPQPGPSTPSRTTSRAAHLAKPCGRVEQFTQAIDRGVEVSPSFEPVTRHGTSKRAERVEMPL